MVQAFHINFQKYPTHSGNKFLENIWPRGNTRISATVATCAEWRNIRLEKGEPFVPKQAIPSAKHLTSKQGLKLDTLRNGWDIRLFGTQILRKINKVSIVVALYFHLEAILNGTPRRSLRGSLFQQEKRLQHRLCRSVCPHNSLESVHAQYATRSSSNSREKVLFAPVPLSLSLSPSPFFLLPLIRRRLWCAYTRLRSLSTLCTHPTSAPI